MTVKYLVLTGWVSDAHLQRKMHERMGDSQTAQMYCTHHCGCHWKCGKPSEGKVK